VTEPRDDSATPNDGLTPNDGVTPNPEKDPEDWVTGDEPMTGPQQSYLNTLAQEAGQVVPDGLSKAEASKLIDELQERTNRGVNTSTGE